MKHPVAFRAWEGATLDSSGAAALCIYFHLDADFAGVQQCSKTLPGLKQITAGLCVQHIAAPQPLEGWD